MDQNLYRGLPFSLRFLYEIMKKKVTECFQMRDLGEGGGREKEESKTKGDSS